MRSFFQKKWVKIPYQIALYSFAIYGFFLVGTYLAMKFKLTNDAGSVDVNNRYYQQIHDKYNQSFKIDSSNVAYYRNEILSRIHLLNEYFPKNANDIMDAWTNSKDDQLALQMLAAIDLKMQDNTGYQKELQEMEIFQRSGSQRQKVHWFGSESCRSWSTVYRCMFSGGTSSLV